MKPVFSSCDYNVILQTARRIAGGHISATEFAEKASVEEWKVWAFLLKTKTGGRNERGGLLPYVQGIIARSASELDGFSAAALFGIKEWEACLAAYRYGLFLNKNLSPTGPEVALALSLALRDYPNAFLSEIAMLIGKTETDAWLATKSNGTWINPNSKDYWNLLQQLAVYGNLGVAELAEKTGHLEPFVQELLIDCAKEIRIIKAVLIDKKSIKQIARDLKEPEGKIKTIIRRGELLSENPRKFRLPGLFPSATPLFSKNKTALNNSQCA